MPEVNKKQFNNVCEVLSQVFLRQLGVTTFSKVLKITISMLNNFFTFGFRSKNSIARVKEVIPKKSGNVPMFDL
jgi:hypothetical protein